MLRRYKRRINSCVTIVVGIVVAVVSQSIPVSVPLRRIVHRLAVVARVAVDVLVAVLLADVGDEPTVVLVQTKPWSRLQPGLRFLTFAPLGCRSLTLSLSMPSSSASLSQASPIPSPSASSWPEFGTNTQLSCQTHQSSPDLCFWSELFTELREHISPACSCFGCTQVQCRGIRQCLCPFHTCSHCLPSQRRTNVHTRRKWKSRNICTTCNASWTLMSVFPQSPYEAGDAAVHLQNALGAAVTLAGLSVRAEPRALASPGLVTCEASFTSPTAEGSLQRSIEASPSSFTRYRTSHGTNALGNI